MSHTPPLRGAFRTDLRARQAYSEGAGIYRILPGAVALPLDTDDLRMLLAWAARERRSLIPRGAGSAMAGGNVGEGVIVDLTAMASAAPVLDLAARSITVSTGTTLGLIGDVAAPHGLRLPPDPLSSRWATSGGAFSTNAAGPRSLRYGAMRNWAERASIVTSEGEALDLARGRPASGAAVERFERHVAPRLREAAALIREAFPATPKNSSGLALDAWLATGDLLDLFIGAEGTLGVATRVTWRLDTIPAHHAALRVELSRLEQLGDAVQALVATGPSSCELLDRTFLHLVGAPEGEGLLLLEYEGYSKAETEGALARGEAATRALGLVAAAARSAESEAEFWAVRHAASPILAHLPPQTRSLQVVEDGCVPIEHLAEYVRLLRNAAAGRGIPIVLFGHAGSGHLHANILPDVTPPGWEAAVESLLQEVTDGVARLGGTLAGEHGDGRLRAGLLERIYGPDVVELFRLVKECFDPPGILNPGVILPARDGTAPISRLKVGADAVPLDADIAAGLRQVEREGGYATPRLELLRLP